MTARDRATLKSYFNVGDMPSEANFADLIDSCFVTMENAGNNNLFVGLNAGNASTTGTVLTAVGIGTLQNVSSGIQATALGYQALNALTTGNYNQGEGYRALYRLVSGNYNTAVGQGAAESIISADYNTAVGFHSLQQATSGGNTAIGYTALRGLTTGQLNTALGCDAGLAVSTGSGNVFLGFGAGYYETGSNKLFIDNTFRASEADGRAKALLYGIFDAAPANQRFNINAIVSISQLPTYASNALAVAGGLATGQLYLNGDNVCAVHA